MEDSKELKNNLDQAANLEEVKHIIAQAGKKLTDDEVGEVAGGVTPGRTLSIDGSDSSEVRCFYSFTDNDDAGHPTNENLYNDFAAAYKTRGTLQRNRR